MLTRVVVKSQTEEKTRKQEEKVELRLPAFDKAVRKPIKYGRPRQ